MTELIPLEHRFWDKVDRGAEAECWPWTGAIDEETGYGRIGRGRRTDGVGSAHRVSWEINVGPIPEGMTVDHTCLIRHCVNPSHLQIVTHAVNSGLAKGRWTHCIHGHEFTEANTYIRKEGRRACRQCKRDRRAAAK